MWAPWHYHRVFFHHSRIAVSVPEPNLLMPIFFPLRSAHLVIAFDVTKLLGILLTAAAMMIVSAPWARDATVAVPELMAKLISPVRATCARVDPDSNIVTPGVESVETIFFPKSGILRNVCVNQVDRRASLADVYLILSLREGIENKHEGQYTRGSKEKCFELAHALSILKQSCTTQTHLNARLDAVRYEVVARFHPVNLTF